MKFKYKGIAIALIIVVLITVFVTGVSAGGPEAPDSISGVVDGASLVRTENGLSMTLHASGLDPGHAVTIWWIIDKNGNQQLDAGDGVCNAAGHIVSESGTYNASGHLALSEPSEDVCFSIDSDDPALTDTQDTVILEVFDHGEHLTGQDLVDSINDFVTGTNPPCEEICLGVGAAVFTP